MPDFRVIAQQPVDAIDRVGPAYDRGLGNANPSTLGNLYEGLKDGLDFSSKLSSRLTVTESIAAETERLNDPETLANEKLKQELDNIKAGQAILEADRQFKLDEEFGRDAEVTKRRKADYELQFLPDEKEAKIAKDKASAEESRARGAFYDRGGPGRGNPERESLNRNKLIAELGKQRRDLTPVPSAEKNAYGEYVAPQIVDPNLQKQLDGLDQQIERLQQDEDEYRKTARSQQSAYEYGESKKELDENNLTEGLKDRGARTQVLKDSLEKGQQAAQYVDPYDEASNVALTSWASEISKINALMDKFVSPEEKGGAQIGLANLFKATGLDRIQAYSESLEGQEKENFDNIVTTATANSGDPDLLDDTQKIITAAKLPPKYAARPKETMYQFATLLTEGEDAIKDPEFKNALRQSPTIAAAQQALDASPIVKIRTRSVASGDPNSSDTSGEPAAQMMTQYTDEKGNVLSQAPVPPPGSEEEGRLNLVGEYLRQRNGQVGPRQAANQFGQQVVDQNRQTQRDVANIPANPRRQQPAQPAQPTQPARQDPYGTPDEQGGPYGAPAQPVADLATPNATPGPITVDQTREPGSAGPSVVEEEYDGYPYTIDKEARIALPKTAIPSSVIDRRLNREVDPKGLGKNAGNYQTRLKEIRHNNKAIRESIDTTQDEIRAKENLLRDMKFLQEKLLASNNTDLLGAKGALQAEYSRFATKFKLGSKRDAEINKTLSDIEQGQGAILSSFLEKEGRSTTVNSPTEQQTVIATVLSANTDYKTFENWIDQQEAFLKREKDIQSFRQRAASDPMSNSPGAVDDFINEYLSSAFSQPLVWNHKKYNIEGNKYTLNEEYADEKDFVPNIRGKADNPRSQYYLTPEEYLKFRGGLRDMGIQPEMLKPEEPGAKATPTPTPKPKGWLQTFGEAIDPRPQEAAAQDITEDSAEEAEGALSDLRENEDFAEALPDETDFFPEQGETGSPQNDRPTVIPTPPEDSYSEPRVATQPTPDVMGEYSYAVLNSNDPAKTLVEERGYEFESAEAAKRYNQLVKKVQDRIKDLDKKGYVVPLGSMEFFLTRYLPNAVGFQQGEEFEIKQLKQMRRLGVIPKETTDKEIAEQAMAYEQARKELGKDSSTATAFLRTVDIAGFVIQNIGLNRGIKAGAGALEAGAVAAGRKLGMIKPGVARPLSKAIEGNKLARGAGEIGTGMVADVGQDLAVSNDPTSPRDMGQLFNEAYSSALWSGGSSVAGLFFKFLKPMYKAAMNSAEASEILAKISVDRYGMTRKEFTDIIAEATARGLDPRGLLPPQMHKILDELAATKMARPYITKYMDERKAILDADIEMNEVQNSMDLVQDKTALQNKFNYDMQTIAARKEAALAANKYNAEGQRAVAISQATNDMTNATTKVVGEITEGGLDSAEKAVARLDKIFKTRNERLGLSKSNASDWVENLETNAESLQATADYLNKTLNNSYGNLDDVFIPKDLFENFVNKLQTDPNIPMGGAVIEDTAKRFRKGGPLDITELSDRAQSLIEMRSKLTNKAYHKELGMEGPQIRLMIEEIDKTLKKTFDGMPNLQFEDDVFKKFMAAQSVGRATRDQLLKRREVIQTIYNNAISREPGLLEKKMFTGKNLDSLTEVFGKDGVKDLRAQVQSMDSITSNIRSIKSAKNFKPDQIEDIYRKARQVGQSNFFFDALLANDIITPDEIATLMGKTDRTDFSEGALRYLLDKTKVAADTIDVARKGGKVKPDITSTLSAFGVSDDDLKKIKTFLTPGEQATLNNYMDNYRAIQKTGGIADVGVNPDTGKPAITAVMSRRLVTSRTAAILELMYSKWQNVASAQDVGKLAEVALDPNPARFIKLLEETAAKMPETAVSGPIKNRAYKGYMDSKNAMQAGRTVQQVLGNLYVQQAVWDRRMERKRREAVAAQPSVGQAFQNRKSPNLSDMANEFVSKLNQRKPQKPPMSLEEMRGEYARRRGYQ